MENSELPSLFLSEWFIKQHRQYNQSPSEIEGDIEYVPVARLAAATARIEQLESVLKKVLNSDMAMREEDEGQTSSALQLIRLVLNSESLDPSSRAEGEK